MGAGAIFAAMLLPRIRQAVSRDKVAIAGTLLHGVATAAVALAENIHVATFATFFAGMAVISTANSLSVSAQLALPDCVRARGMSMYQMAIMGASAFGAATLGQVATSTSVQASLLIVPVTSVAGMLIAYRLVKDREMEEDFTPSREFKVPVAEVPPDAGNVVVMIEYEIDPARAEDFRKLMQQSRRSRLRQGALSWHLLHDISDPGRFIEQIVDVSWVEHLRRFDRVTAGDVALRERKLAFHIRETPPAVTRYVVDVDVRG